MTTNETEATEARRYRGERVCGVSERWGFIYEGKTAINKMIEWREREREGERGRGREGGRKGGGEEEGGKEREGEEERFLTL